MSGRYASLYLLSRFQAEVDRLMQEAIGLPDGEITFGEWQPAIDIVETGTSILILVDLPGFSAGDLRVEVKGPLLVLSGSKPTAPPGGRISFLCMERSQGRFGREIQLFWPVNSHLGTARLADGLLTIEFPKIKDKRQAARRLQVAEPPDGKGIEDEPTA
jgi:HSP20 family molecular chaperone IbpA